MLSTPYLRPLPWGQQVELGLGSKFLWIIRRAKLIELHLRPASCWTHLPGNNTSMNDPTAVAGRRAVFACLIEGLTDIL